MSYIPPRTIIHEPVKSEPIGDHLKDFSKPDNMANPYAKAKRVVRNDPDEPLAETENYRLLKQLNDFVLCKKYTGACTKIPHDCAMMILELNADYQELYLK